MLRFINPETHLCVRAHTNTHNQRNVLRKFEFLGFPLFILEVLKTGLPDVAGSATAEKPLLVRQKHEQVIVNNGHGRDFDHPTAMLQEK